MSAITKDEFKELAQGIRGLSNVTYNIHARQVSVDEFCATVGEHDSGLAAKIRAFNDAAADMRNYLDGRFDGKPNEFVIRIGRQP